MSKFKFSAGPWNVHSGADSYGPATRKEIDFDTKLAKFAELGFFFFFFHDDDAVPNINSYTETLNRHRRRNQRKSERT